MIRVAELMRLAIKEVNVLSRFAVTAVFIITHLLVKLAARHSVSLKQRIYIRVASSD
jgi:hypothetical protein